MAFDLIAHSFYTLEDGSKLRFARFDPPGAVRGTVLVLPGRREFIEKKYLELSERLLSLGFRLIVVEPRGQGLSTRFLTGALSQRDHIVDFNTHLDDVRAFYRDVVKPLLDSPLVLHGHSLGGHLLLRWMAEDNPHIAGAFFTAPMLALAGVPAHLTAYGMSWASVRLFGQETRYAPSQHDFTDIDRVFAKNPLTQDEQRFKVIENYFDAHPNLTVGGVTWAWLLAALRSMQTAQSWQYLAKIDVPVLALVGDSDAVTPSPDISRYLNVIPRMRTHVIAGARHDLLNEISPVRKECWDRITGFLKIVTLSP